MSGSALPNPQPSEDRDRRTWGLAGAQAPPNTARGALPLPARPCPGHSGRRIPLSWHLLSGLTAPSYPRLRPPVPRNTANSRARHRGGAPSPPPPPPTPAPWARSQDVSPGRLGVRSRRQAVCRNCLRAPEISSGSGVLAGAPSCPLACVPYLSRACPARSVLGSPCRHSPPPTSILGSPLPPHFLLPNSLRDSSGKMSGCERDPGSRPRSASCELWDLGV